MIFPTLLYPSCTFSNKTPYEIIKSSQKALRHELATGWGGGEGVITGHWNAAMGYGKIR